MKDKDSAWFIGRLNDLGRSQADLARHMGVDRAIINRLLSGDQRVTINHVEQLCNYLNEPPSKVLAAFGMDFGERNKSWLSDAALEDDRRKRRVSIGEDGEDGIPWSIPGHVVRGCGAGDASSCVIVRISDDNMSPILGRGDHVIVDTSDTTVGAGIYALDHNGQKMIRRLDPVVGSKIVRVKSIATGEVNDVDVKSIDVFGKVLWRGGCV